MRYSRRVFLFLLAFGAVALLMKGKGADLSLGNTAASAIGLSPAEYLESAMVAGTVGRGGGGGGGGHGGGGGGGGGGRRTRGWRGARGRTRSLGRSWRHGLLRR